MPPAADVERVPPPVFNLIIYASSEFRKPDPAGPDLVRSFGNSGLRYFDGDLKMGRSFPMLSRLPAGDVAFRQAL